MSCMVVGDAQASRRRFRVGETRRCAFEGFSFLFIFEKHHFSIICILIKGSVVLAS